MHDLATEQKYHARFALFEKLKSDSVRKSYRYYKGGKYVKGKQKFLVPQTKYFVGYFPGTIPWFAPN